MSDEPKMNEKKLSPTQVPDYKDPGDETQRNYRYQNGYGVILLIASARGDKSYRAIWCEHHDDYLCERYDDLFDAYQIKTKKPERGYWKLTDQELRGSIKKFCNLLAKFGNDIQDFFFVSNTEALNVSQDTQNQNDLRRSPVQFLRAIAEVESENDIPVPFNKTFQDLLTYCEQPPDILFSVLKNLFMIKGPGRDSFDAEIVQTHLPSLKACSDLPIPTLNKISNALIQKIYSASALHVEDPNQHIFSLNMISSKNPVIKAKRVPLEILDEIILENISIRKPLSDAEVVRSNNELSEKRRTLLIYSHPSDIDFARWLSLQLINNGYQVWSDILDIEKSDEDKKKRDEVLSEETFKFIFVLTNTSNQDSQSLENLKLAYDLSHKKDYREFIITAELEELTSDKNILLDSIFTVGFSDGWAKGLHNLLEVLDKEQVPINLSSSPSKSNLVWRSQFDPERGVTNESEEYFSNWFRIDLPEQIYFHEIQRSGIGLVSVPTDLPYPGFQHNKYLVTFASADDFLGRIGEFNSIKESNAILTQDFLQEDYDHSLVSPRYAWNLVVNLLNQAWDLYFEASKLGKYELANKRKCHYFHNDYGIGRIYFTGVDGQKTWRFLVGKHGDNHWHFAFQGRSNLHPYPHYLVKSHVLASSDGLNIWESDKRLHNARRSWFKDWWNDNWRDRLLAAISFVADSSSTLNIPVGNDVFLNVSTFPETFISPVSYTLPDDENIYEENLPDDEEEFEDEDSDE